MHSAEDEQPYETKWWTAATDAGVAGAGLGLPEWLIDCSRAIFSSDFATAEEQVDLRKIYYFKAILVCKAKFTIENLLFYCLLSSMSL